MMALVSPAMESSASPSTIAWVAFATSGNPGWPQFDLKRRATMRFDTTSELVEDPRSAERVLWKSRR
jgi:para-nitrobenzyl esterase